MLGERPNIILEFLLEYRAFCGLAVQFREFEFLPFRFDHITSHRQEKAAHRVFYPVRRSA